MKRGLKAALSAKEVAALVQIGLPPRRPSGLSPSVRRRLMFLELIEENDLGPALTDTGRHRLAIEDCN